MLRVGDLLANSARRHPEAVALVDRGATVTYRRLAARAWALARGLLGSGVRPGQTVGVLSGNSAFAAETYLGIAAAGAVAVPYNWRWAPPELVFALNDSGARVLLVERAFAEAAEAARATGDLESLGDIVVEGPAYEALLAPGPRPVAGGGPDDPHLVLYTGGTTGFPKGALLSHRNVLANALNEIVDTHMEPSDRTLLITPMFHSASLLCWFLPHLVLGATSVLLREFDEELVARTIERERVTNGFLVPSMVRRLLASGELERHDLSSYRRAYVGGAAFGLDDKLALTEAVPRVRLYYQYGLTEAGPIVTRLQPDEALRPDLDGSIGREFVLTEVTVRGQDGAELGAGEVGELCVRGPNVMLGYLGRPSETCPSGSPSWSASACRSTRAARSSRPTSAGSTSGAEDLPDRGRAPACPAADRDLATGPPTTTADGAHVPAHQPRGCTARTRVVARADEIIQSSPAVESPTPTVRRGCRPGG
jgi:acyl-CoA synthetase (AMP-forming)/AMP-acid ligase II